MKIDGREIASLIKENQKPAVLQLKKKNHVPHLTVVFVGDDLSSEAYIRQKKLYGESLGIAVTVDHFSAKTDPETFLTHIKQLNSRNDVTGIIIQRPVPLTISKETLDLSVIPQKDVDGFHPQSQFQPPVALAVVKIIEYVYQIERPNSPFAEIVKKKNILIIGRGESGGKPISETLTKMDIPVTIANSKTENIKKLALESDIIISCVGKSHIVRREMVTNKTVLIGVGLHSENGKLHTDYDEEEIKDRVAFFTPVPGGVGPVNVACLFENVIRASSHSS